MQTTGSLKNEVRNTRHLAPIAHVLSSEIVSGRIVRTFPIPWRYGSVAIL